MANEITVTATQRSTNGTAAARRLRRTGVLPAVLCNEKGEATAIQINEHDFQQMLGKHSGENLLISLAVDDQAVRRVLLREVQHHPVSGHPLHADFVEISMTKKMRVTIPVELVGEPVGVTQQGGMLEQIMREVEVECLPDDLVEELRLDVSKLSIGESLHIGDLIVGEGMTLLDEPDMTVATVVASRSEEEEAEEAAESGGAEPEVITARKDKDETTNEEDAG